MNTAEKLPTQKKSTDKALRFRQKRIEKLKSKIRSGKYRIDNFELAKAIFLSV